MHGFQIWVALPKDKELMDPTFSHTEAEDLPQWEDENISFKLIAGSAFHRVSPVPVHSDLYFIEIKSKNGGAIDIGKDLYGESGLYILEGGIISDDKRFGPKQILVAKESQLCAFELEPNTTVYIFGGHPFEEERKIYWNFVASSKELIEEAKEKWKNGDFPKVLGEHDFVPLPSS